jgi:hypothetical protein
LLYIRFLCPTAADIMQASVHFLYKTFPYDTKRFVNKKFDAQSDRQILYVHFVVGRLSLISAFNTLRFIQ